MSKTILTGIKPTGSIHLGNYLGAMRPAIEASQNSKDQNLYFIADYHALTATRDAKQFQQAVHHVACAWLALGLDPSKVIFYRQSQIPEIFELNWILACHTPKGDLNRAHAYKALIAANEQKGQKDLDHGVNAGLFTYPVLMAADILMFDTNIVPVGQDQVQHVEMARSMAQRINQYYGEVLALPQEQIQKDVGLVPGLDGRKMSKSYQNVIPLFDTPKRIRKLINKIATDSSEPNDPKDPDASHLFELYGHFASDTQVREMRERYLQGISWGEAKAELFAVVEAELAAAWEKYQYYFENKTEVEKILQSGEARAREIASKNLKRVKSAVLGMAQI